MYIVLTLVSDKRIFRFYSYFFQILSLKIIQVDDHQQLTSYDMFNYAEKFKIVLENKTKMNSALYKFIVTRLIDNVFIASMLMSLTCVLYFMSLI